MGVYEKLGDEAVDALFAAILSLETTQDARAFFEDLNTIRELREMVQRFAVARMLHRGDTYEDIARETGASSATISRVKRSLYYGADGYLRVLEHRAVKPGKNRGVGPDGQAI